MQLWDVSLNSIGMRILRLDSNTLARLPNLISNVFSLNKEAAVPFIFSAWILLDPQEAYEMGSKCIFSFGPDLEDCNYGIEGNKGDANGDNSSSMIRFCVNHDGTADEELTQ